MHRNGTRLLSATLSIFFLTATAAGQRATTSFDPGKYTSTTQYLFQQQKPTPHDYVQFATTENCEGGNADNSCHLRQYNTTFYRPAKKDRVLRMSPRDANTTIPADAPIGMWIGAIEFQSDDTAPARPNCTENKISARDMQKIFESNQVNSVMDFIGKIPEGTLQKFTFMYDSKSLQGETSWKFPRVLRFNTDSTVIMSYTCDPKSLDFNTIEMITFDPESRRFHFSHYSFPLPDHPEAGIYNRLSKHQSVDHKSCLACHGGSDPRPNWQQYDNWPGAYGSVDDRIGFTKGRNQFTWKKEERQVNREGKEPRSPEQDALIEKESAMYRKFRESSKGNPCFDSLPWPSKDAVGFAHYPYIPFEKQMNYNYRPNANLMNAVSRTNSQRLARKFETHPTWNSLKYAAVGGALKCQNLQSVLTERLKNIPSYDFTRPRSSKSTSAAQLQSSNLQGYFQDFLAGDADQTLIALGRAFGFYASDWGTNFNKGGPVEMGQQYNADAFSVANMTLGVLLHDLARQHTELRPFIRGAYDTAHQFGRQFMCVDELANVPLLTVEENVALCQQLENLDRNSSVDEKLLASWKPSRDRETREAGPAREQVPEPSSAAGHRILTKNCAQCHNGDVLKYNFADEKQLIKQLGSLGEGMLGMVETKLGSPTACEMPYSSMGACLSDAERESVLRYLRGLMK